VLTNMLLRKLLTGVELLKKMALVPNVVALVVVEAILTVLWNILLVVPLPTKIPLIAIFPVEFGARKSPIRLLLTLLVPVAATFMPLITTLVLLDERS